MFRAFRLFACVAILFGIFSSDSYADISLTQSQGKKSGLTSGPSFDEVALDFPSLVLSLFKVFDSESEFKVLRLEPIVSALLFRCSAGAGNPQEVCPAHGPTLAQLTADLQEAYRNYVESMAEHVRRRCARELVLLSETASEMSECMARESSASLIPDTNPPRYLYRCPLMQRGSECRDAFYHVVRRTQRYTTCAMKVLTGESPMYEEISDYVVNIGDILDFSSGAIWQTCTDYMKVWCQQEPRKFDCYLSEGD